MIYINKHLEQGKTYGSAAEMFPHLYDENGNRTQKIFIYFDEVGKNIIVEADTTSRAELVEAVARFIETESKKAAAELERLQKAIERQKNIINALKEAKNE